MPSVSIAYEKWGAWLAALGGGLWCASYMWPMLDPFSLQIVLQEDWAQHALGFLFFRNEPLRFPLGAIQGFLYPLGTTLGYMDSIPLIGLLLRPFDALLPGDFQYLGLWILACSMGLAFVGARVVALATPHWEQQALAGVLLAAAPVLLMRLIHPALCAHVLLVAALRLCFRPSRRGLLAAFALLVISAATHPYLAVMVLSLLIALPWRLFGMRLALGVAACEVGIVALVLFVLGYADPGLNLAARGFGEYSANLNTFFNSMGLSRLLPALPQGPSQYEGYAYLGAGWLLLSAAALTVLALPRTRGQVGSAWRSVAAWPLTAAVVMALFALASPVYWGKHALFRVPLYDHVTWLAQVFRASGRFIWPLLYMIELGSALCVLYVLRDKRLLATCLLIAALGIQMYDVEATRAQNLFGRSTTRIFSAPEWNLAYEGFEHLVLYPAEIQSACNKEQPYRSDVVNGLAYLAYRFRWTFNSGYAARYATNTPAYCAELKRQVEQGKLDARTVYVIQRWNVKDMRAAGATCGRLERMTVCIADAQHPFARYLEANAP
jgi:hypothetical protein